MFAFFRCLIQNALTVGGLGNPALLLSTLIYLLICEAEPPHFILKGGVQELIAPQSKQELRPH